VVWCEILRRECFGIRAEPLKVANHDEGARGIERCQGATIHRNDSRQLRQRGQGGGPGGKRQLPARRSEAPAGLDSSEANRTWE
jgi:hypothetical protein